MSASLVAVFLWAIAANVLAMIPSRDNHWTRAYLLIGVGLPLLVWVTVQNGPWVGLLVLVAGMSMLRWPVLFLWRWLRGLVERGPADG